MYHLKLFVVVFWATAANEDKPVKNICLHLLTLEKRLLFFCIINCTEKIFTWKSISLACNEQQKSARELSSLGEEACCLRNFEEWMGNRWGVESWVWTRRQGPISDRYEEWDKTRRQRCLLRSCQRSQRKLWRTETTSSRWRADTRLLFSSSQCRRRSRNQPFRVRWVYAGTVITRRSELSCCWSLRNEGQQAGARGTGDGWWYVCEVTVMNSVCDSAGRRF